MGVGVSYHGFGSFQCQSENVRCDRDGSGVWPAHAEAGDGVGCGQKLLSKGHEMVLIDYLGHLSA